ELGDGERNTRRNIGELIAEADDGGVDFSQKVARRAQVTSDLVESVFGLVKRVGDFRQSRLELGQQIAQRRAQYRIEKLRREVADQRLNQLGHHRPVVSHFANEPDDVRAEGLA